MNLSPSLAIDASLDQHIKSNLIADTYNLLGVKIVDKKEEASAKLKARMNTRHGRSVSRNTVPFNKTARFLEALRDTLDEYTRRGGFIRIFPAKGTNYYDMFFH